MEIRRILVPLSAALIAALSSAGMSGLLISDAAAQIARRPEDEDDVDVPLVLAVANARGAELISHRSHSSHSSHSSHRSHYSSSGGGGGGGGDGYVPSPPTPAPEPPPPPPKPALVSFVAFPGGRIYVDGTLRGTDATGVLTLKEGTHDLRVENRFLGEHKASVELAAGQTGVVTIDW